MQLITLGIIATRSNFVKLVIMLIVLIKTTYREINE